MAYLIRHSALQGISTCFLHCFLNYRETRTPWGNGAPGAEVPGHRQEKLWQTLIVGLIKIHFSLLIKKLRVSWPPLLTNSTTLKSCDAAQLCNRISRVRLPIEVYRRDGCKELFELTSHRKIFNIIIWLGLRIVINSKKEGANHSIVLCQFSLNVKSVMIVFLKVTFNENSH